MTKLIVVFLLASFQGIGQTAPDRTLGQRNGRWWNSLSPVSKGYYLIGLQEGFGLGHRLGIASVITKNIPVERALELYREEDNNLPRDGALYFPSTMSFGDMVKGMDRFYDEPANLILPVVEALEIFSMKAAGATSETVDAKLAAYRLRNIKAMEEEKTKGKKP